MNNINRNLWYISKLIDGTISDWLPIMGSAGNKSWAEGYLACLESYYPHGKYKLVNNKGEVVREIQERGGINVN